MVHLIGREAGFPLERPGLPEDQQFRGGVLAVDGYNHVIKPVGQGVAEGIR